MSNRTELQTLKRKVKRLECKLAEAEAEAEVNLMMAHDLSGPAITEYMTHNYPEWVKRWKAQS